MLFFADTLAKARTRGAKNIKPAAGKYGALTSSDPDFYPTEGGIRYLKASELGKLAKIQARYLKRGIAVQYVAPSQVEHLDHGQRVETRAGRQAARTYVEAVQAPKIVVPVPAKVEQTLQADRADHLLVDAVDILRDRVSRWTRPREFRNTVNQKDMPELEALLARRREISRGTLGKNRREKRLHSREYAVIQRRIETLQGTTHATRGAGFSAMSDAPAVFDALPDIGINPNQKPMSYLLSLGWYHRTADQNILNASESAALIYEYRFLVSRTVGHMAKLLKLDAADRRGAENVAVICLLESARLYHPSKSGASDKHFNFAAYTMKVLPRDIVRAVMLDLKGKHTHQEYTEELDEQEESEGRVHGPHAYIETPAQYLQRKDLAGDIEHDLARVLTPTEYAVLTSRLNIYDPKSDGITDTALDNGEKIGGIKPWLQVKQDAMAHARALGIDDAPLEKTGLLHYRRIFDQALEKLRSVSEKTPGLGRAGRSNLRQFAEVNRRYLQGRRHEIFDTDDSIRRFVISVSPPSDKEVARAEARHEKAREKMLSAKTPQGITSARDKFEVIDGELRKLRVRSRTHRLLRTTPSAAVKERPRELASSLKVDAFWDRNRWLADRLHMDLRYRDLRLTPNTVIPLTFRQHALRAKLMAQLAIETQALTAGTIVRKMGRNVPPPTAIGKHPVRMSLYDYQSILEWALHTKRRKR